MRLYLFAFVLAFLFHTETSFAQHGQPASEIMREAMQMAAKENMNVFIIFHASWCGWCHKMDSAINDKSCKDFFYKNYVIRHLVVDESKDKKDLENRGADALRTKYHGDDEGIPFWLIFDKDGKEKGMIEVPERPSAIQFGGKDNNTLFITGRSKLFSVRIR